MPRLVDQLACWLFIIVVVLALYLGVFAHMALVTATILLVFVFIWKMSKYIVDNSKLGD
jgi:hypothetical protein